MQNITNQEIRTVQKLLARTRAKTDPLLLAKQGGEFRHPEMPKVIAAQNTLRDLMTAVFEGSAPFSEDFCAEMAIRLASYAISAVPIERQEHILGIVLRSLPAAHRRRLAQGVVINTEWASPAGVPSPNVPDKRNTN